MAQQFCLLILLILAGPSWAQDGCPTGLLTFPVQAGSQTFHVLRHVGEGDNSVLYLTAENEVLRTFKSKNPARSTQLFVRGYEALAAAGVKDLAHVRVAGETYVIQEYKNVQLLLRDFLFRFEEIRSENPLLHSLMVQKLEEFTISTAKFSDIGDFHSGQMAWTGSSWTLIDWNSEHEYAYPDSQDTCLLGIEEPTPEVCNLRKRIESAVREFRQRHWMVSANAAPTQMP
ncbi:MAG: hypothetical protein AB7F86_11155 [Bdellovibrionales bacterium]